MKSLKSFFSLVLIASLLACSSDDDNVGATTDNSSSINEFLNHPDGLRINEFVEDNVNKINLVDSFLFEFMNDGSVTATNDNETILGTYLVFRDDNRTELRMTFPNNSILFELSDDWYFISQNDNAIRFEDNQDVVQFVKQ